MLPEFFFFSKLCANTELCENCAISFCEKFLMLQFIKLAIFFGFTFNTKLSIFKLKWWERKLFSQPINVSIGPISQTFRDFSGVNSLFILQGEGVSKNETLKLFQFLFPLQHMKEGLCLSFENDFYWNVPKLFGYQNNCLVIFATPRF